MKRIIAGVSALLLCLSLCTAPAKAEYINNSTFWQWVAGDNRALRNIAGYIPGMGVCPDENSPDGKHHASTYQLGEVLGNYVCTCEYCGQTFIAHESDIQSAYSDYVEAMPVSGVDNAGGFLWYPDWSDTTGWSLTYYYGSHFADNNDTLPIIDNGKYVTQGARHIYGKFNYNYRDYSFTFQGGVVLPISGTYSYIRSEAVKHYNDSGGGDVAYYNDTLLGMKAAGSSVSFNVGGKNVGGNEHDVYAILPIFRVVPVEQFPVETTIKYQDNTRPGNLHLDVTINTDNPVPAPSGNVVNETNNSVYNPVTGDTTTYNSWQYDYSSRTYTFEGDDNSTTVTYGDQNITIQEGSTTYNIYYLTQQPQHQHTYAVTSERNATCAGTGSKTYTCSSCGHSYTETIPALGHDWQIKATAATEYDENGQLLSQGYTIYKCSRCGEEYRSDDGTVPGTELMPLPDGETGLTEYWNKVTGMFQKIPEMFGDITRFLHDTWSYVPEDVFTLIYFSLSMVALVGLVGWIFRR